VGDRDGCGEATVGEGEVGTEGCGLAEEGEAVTDGLGEGSGETAGEGTSVGGDSGNTWANALCQTELLIRSNDVKLAPKKAEDSLRVYIILKSIPFHVQEV
jgi:hypothetical protein